MKYGAFQLSCENKPDGFIISSNLKLISLEDSKVVMYPFALPMIVWSCDNFVF